MNRRWRVRLVAGLGMLAVGGVASIYSFFWFLGDRDAANAELAQAELLFEYLVPGAEYASTVCKRSPEGIVSATIQDPPATLAAGIRLRARENGFAPSPHQEHVFVRPHESLWVHESASGVLHVSLEFSASCF
jgi:hypothetical protein